MITGLNYSTNENFVQKATIFIAFSTIPFFLFHNILIKKAVACFHLVLISHKTLNNTIILLLKYE